MVQETDPGLGLVSREAPGEIALQNNARLALVGISSRESMALSLGVRRAFSIITTNPGIVSVMAAIAYENPYLIDVMARAGETVPTTLKDIRESFPSVSTFFKDEVLSEVLTKFPGIEGRVNEEQSLLKGEGVAVEKSELVLRILIQTGNLQAVRLEDYVKIAEAHDLYQSMATVLFERSHLLGNEENTFVDGIGQRLLKKRRLLLETKEAGRDTNGSIVRHERGDRDFKGRIGEIVIQQRAINTLMVGGLDRKSEFVQNLLANIQHAREVLELTYPGRLAEINTILGYLQGDIKLLRWTEEPGAADLTPGERISFLNGE